MRFWRPDIEADVEDELGLHLESRTEELIAQGAAPHVARAQALEEFGDLDRVRADLRAIDRRILQRQQRVEWWNGVVGETRAALRRLLRQPAFTVPAFLTLALGIGAAAAIFTVLDAVVLRPLPYPESGRLVRVTTPVPGVGAGSEWGLAKGQFLYLQRDARALDAIALYQLSAVTIGSDAATPSTAERERVALVSASAHEVFAARSALGRALRPLDNLPAQPPVALLTHDHWRRRFGEDSTVVGRSILLDGRPTTIVGVLAPDATMPEELQRADLRGIGLWMPLAINPAEPARPSHIFRSVARLRPDVSIDDARTELARLTARLPEVLPAAYSPAFMERYGFSSALTSLRDDVLGDIGRTLWMLFASVGLVVAIAVVNVANLFLVRAEVRRRETAIRVALGASRGLLVRHFMSEAVLLAVGAAIAALALASWSIELLAVLSPPGIPRLGDIAVGWRTVAFTAILAVVLGILLGVVPLLRHAPALGTLTDIGRGLTASRRQHALRHALVIAQIAGSLVLLAGGGLLVRSFKALAAVDPGIDPARVLTFQLLLPERRSSTPDVARAAFREISARLAAIPEVERVGATNAIPLTGEMGCSIALVPERPLAPGDRPPCVPIVVTLPGYFETLGIPVRGRAPTWSDMEGTGVAVVSDAAARRLWPQANPIGRSVGASTFTDMRPIIGVAGDVRATALDQPPIEAIYLSAFPVPLAVLGGTPRNVGFVVRTTDRASVEHISAAVRRTIAEFDPQIPVTNLRMMEELVAQSMVRLSFSMRLLGIAAAMALVLSVVGIYGVVSYVVARQRTEIGIRMALGARESTVGGLVIRQAVSLAIAGVAIGLVAAVFATRVLDRLLYGVRPTDPVTLALVAVLLIVLAVVASLVPARRAMRVNPVEALRHD